MSHDPWWTESETESHSVQFSSLQSLSCIQLFATPWTAARQASLSITNSRSSPKLMAIESVMPSNHLILCCPLLLLPSIFPSIRVFSCGSALHIRWPKYRSFSFSRSPSNEYSDLISFRMDWFDLLAVQEILKSFFSTTIWEHQFFSAQPSLWPKLSHLYMTTGKTIAFPSGSEVKASAHNAGDLGSIPGLGRSPGEGKGYPLQLAWRIPWTV